MAYMVYGQRKIYAVAVLDLKMLNQGMDDCEIFTWPARLGQKPVVVTSIAAQKLAYKHGLHAAVKPEFKTDGCYFFKAYPYYG